ncbi:MAG: acetyltransferase [Stenomitos frigidus ULC029]
MLLQDKRTGSLIEVVEIVDLVNPAKDKISGRVQSGQEEQDQEPIAKDTLIFPSGEDLPRCWLEADYREHETPGSVPH